MFKERSIFKRQFGYCGAMIKNTQVHLKIAKGSLNVLNTKTKEAHSVKGMLTRKISPFYYAYL